MTKGTRVFVAGGTGLVGSALARRLAGLGAEVTASYFSRPPQEDGGGVRFARHDLTQFDACVDATRGAQAVCICAAQTFGAKVMKERPTALVLPNLQINAGLLEACRVNGVERVLFISSSTVYQEAFYPIREDELDLNAPTYPLYMGVGWMKRYIEQLARFYVSRYGMRIGIVRPTNIYGPRDKFDEETAHVLPALITRALERQTPYVVWGDGYTVRDFLYVDDFVEDLVEILDRGCTGEPLNVSSGTTITIREAVDVILDVCGHRVTPQYDVTKPNAIPYRILNTTKFEALFGRRRRTAFRDGIAQTVAWYRGSTGTAAAKAPRAPAAKAAGRASARAAAQ